MKLKSAYDNFDEESTITGLECKDPTLTQQHDEPGANINNIVATYMKTGELPQRSMPPQVGDFTDAPDMQTALNLIVAAKDAFMEQPAEIRAKFHNDPSEFVEFCSNKENKEEMYKMGLLSNEATAAHKANLERLLREQQANQADAEAFRKAQNAPKS